MAYYTNLITLSICLIVLSTGCYAQLEFQNQNLWGKGKHHEQQQHRLRGKTQCNIQRLNNEEPSRRFESEAGVTEFWNPDRPEFECAGVEVERKEIQSRGLVLPCYSNAHKLMYVVQGNGIHGAVIPGCAETFESQPGSDEQQQRERQTGERQQRERQAGEQQQRERQAGRRSDRNQKLRRIREGDVVALPAGITHWLYNDGEVPLVTVSLIDVAGDSNQLDLNYRKFSLAGNPQRGQHSQHQRGRQGQRRQEEEQQEEGEHRNIFNGFNDELLADAFNVDTEIIRQLSGRDDHRGTIVRAERLELSLPEYQQEEQEREQRGHGSNGLEETFCTLKLRENIGKPSRADLFNPRAGRISTANSQTLPILSQLQLSAERGTLYSNAIIAPYWNVNAHSILYAIRGNARIQVVGNNGNTVFDDEIRKGQLVIVPQNFAVLKKAGNQGFEYISFKTNDNAMTNQIAGRLSTFRGLPEEVLMNAYRIDREQARNLKNNRQEATLFSSQLQSQGRREYA